MGACAYPSATRSCCSALPSSTRSISPSTILRAHFYYLLPLRPLLGYLLSNCCGHSLRKGRWATSVQLFPPCSFQPILRHHPRSSCVLTPTAEQEARVAYWNETVLYNNDSVESATLAQALPEFIKSQIRHIENVNPWRATALGLDCRFDDFKCLQPIVVYRPGVPTIQMDWSGALDNKLDAAVRKQVLEAPWAEETRNAVDRPAQTAALQKVWVEITLISTLGSVTKLRARRKAPSPCRVHHLMLTRLWA